MDPHAFLTDLEAKPDALRALADRIDAGDLRWPLGAGTAPSRVLLTGMGSSWFAAQVAALRMRRLGVAAVAELSSADTSYPDADDLLVVGVSASGGSAETLDFVRRYARPVALTNTASSPITGCTEASVEMHAGPEPSGVACRSYQHTLVALLALEEQLGGVELGLADVVRRAAEATADLLGRRGGWLPEVCAALDGPHGAWTLAPADRIGAALQGALMLREGPRRAADGCETGDWSHVDVYLTKTLDYRALVFTGSRHDPAAATWMRDRGSTAVKVGGAPFDATGPTVRYAGDTDPLVTLLTEVLVAELVAATWWLAGG
jgi:glutamine---fructose-6-phosphate transaminase (isomerizing)